MGRCGSTGALDMRYDERMRPSISLPRLILALSTLAPVASACETGRPAAPSNVAPVETVGDEGPAAKVEGDERRLGFIRRVSFVEREAIVHFDPAEMLTGEAAVQAAKARGAESPPPNDYFLVNDDTEEVEVPAPFDVPAVVQGEDGHGGDPSDLHTIPLWELAAAIHEDPQYFDRVPFWLTLDDGRIVRIEQQYLP